MNVLAFAASNSSTSINRHVVEHAAARLKAEFLPSVEARFIHLRDYEMPIFSVDREREDGIPPQARDFFQAITEADALVISFAEHNGSYTAAYKNVFDWASRIDKKVYQDRPVLLLSAAPGGGGGKNVLATAVDALPFYGGEVTSSLSIPRFYRTFDQEAGELVDPELAEALGEALRAFARRLTAEDEGG